MDTLDDLANLTTREMQAMGALCLFRFCEAKGISHPTINELIDHLLSILVTPLLDGWERKGAALDLSGRGDPLPDSLDSQLTDDVREVFARLVDFVVEIGLADMYTLTTKRPLHYLMRCFAILDANELERPTVSELFKDRVPREDSSPDWGQTLAPEQFEKVKSVFGKT